MYFIKMFNLYYEAINMLLNVFCVILENILINIDNLYQ